MIGRRWLCGKTVYIALLMLTQFAVGVAMERYGWLPGAQRRPPTHLGQALEPFWETWHLVQTKYVDRQAVQTERLTHGAIKGMLDALGDVGHNSHLTREEASRVENDFKGSLEGIGIDLSSGNGRAVVVNTAGARAQATGLRGGDLIVEVDGRSTPGLSLKQIEEVIRHGAGAWVHLRVRRGDDALLLDFHIARAEVDVPTVSWRMWPGTLLAHLAIREFNARTHGQLRAALAQLRQQQCQGLIWRSSAALRVRARITWSISGGTP